MLYGETEVRANLRNRDGKRVLYLGKGDQLTSAARDFLSRERIAVLPAEQARPARYRLIGGGFAEEKPEHWTHLDAQTLVPKTHPRIAFRGAVDTLEAELLWCTQNAPELEAELMEILAFVRRLIRCDVLDEALPDMTLCGLTEAEQRTRSHRPQEFYGQTHFMPEPADGAAILALNRCRTAARSAELAAVRAFTDREGNPTRVDILRAMNRLSSMLYLLMIQKKANKGKTGE